MTNKKYYENYQYITTVFLEENNELTDKILVDLQNDNNIYGIVIGHWTTDYEHESEDVAPIQFRALTKKENITDEILQDIDFEKEFLGILYWEDNRYCEYVLNIDDRHNCIGGWYTMGKY